MQAGITSAAQPLVGLIVAAKKEQPIKKETVIKAAFSSISLLGKPYRNNLCRPSGPYGALGQPINYFSYGFPPLILSERFKAVHDSNLN